MKYTLWICAVIFVTTSCVKKEFDLDTLRTPRDYSLEEAREVNIIYSDSAIMRVRITGPLLRRYVYRFRAEDEFPEGVKVTFFDPNGRPTAWLSGKYAIRKPQDYETIVRDSVVLYNTQGEKLEGLELVWDENEQLITSEKFVKITRPDEIIYGRGFTSNQDFTKYTIYAVEGEMLFDQLGLDKEN